MRFRIHHSSLSDFFREYHADVLDDPQYQRGDVTRIDSREFDRVADTIWGLAFERYDLPHYTFRVLDEEKLSSIGLAAKGEFI